MELNAYGREWLDKQLAKIDENGVYASIGAYDPEAFAKYLEIRKEELTKIASEHQDDPEFQARNTPQA